MVGEWKGEVHNINGEQPRIGGGRGGYRGGVRGGRGGGRGRGGGIANTEPFGLPILDEDTMSTMKNNSPSILPNFHRLISEDPKTFLFEFEVLYRYYDYFIYTKKLKLFPATLKDSTLKWFMGLGANSIRTWEEMKTTFLEKYKDYCHCSVFFSKMYEKNPLKIMDEKQYQQ